MAGIPEPNLKVSLGHLVSLLVCKYFPNQRPLFICVVLQFVFEDLLERAKEREEKEVKRKRRAADDFNELLRAEKVSQEVISCSRF